MKIIGIALLLSSAFATSGSIKSMPVQIGLYGDQIDACPSLGEVTGRTLVHTGPGDDYPLVKKLHNRSTVYICGGTESDQWTSVVVVQGDLSHCQVSSPIPAPKDYTGPCVSGWVRSNAIKVVAG